MWDLMGTVDLVVIVDLLSLVMMDLVGLEVMVDLVGLEVWVPGRWRISWEDVVFNAGEEGRWLGWR